MAAMRSLRPYRLRRQSSAVSPVIGTVLAVAITIILGTVLYVLVTGMLTPPPPAPPAVALSSNGWVGGVYSATVAGTVNTATMDVGSLTYKVEDPYSNIFFTGKSDESKTTNGITVTVHYSDTDNDGKITTSDVIRVTVDPPAAGAQAISGGVIRLIHDNAVVANHSIE